MGGCRSKTRGGFSRFETCTLAGKCYANTVGALLVGESFVSQGVLLAKTCMQPSMEPQPARPSLAGRSPGKQSAGLFSFSGSPSSLATPGSRIGNIGQISTRSYCIIYSL